jgi:hypothetical protein
MRQRWAIATFAEKQTVPASDNRTANRLFFIPQSSISDHYSSWRFDRNDGGETQFTITSPRFQSRTFGEASLMPLAVI